MKNVDKIKEILEKISFIKKRFQLYCQRVIAPEIIIKIIFYKKLGYRLNLANPKTFNEKLQWLKFNDRNSLYTILVDKYAVKKYVSAKIGEQYIIPTLGVWSNFDDIDFSKLPNQFVLKCTHDSGSVVVVKDKNSLNMDEAKKVLNRGLSFNYYYSYYEWPYKNVSPRIIAEKYMLDITENDFHNNGLTDYKFMCFNGEVKCIFTCTQRRSNSGLKVTFFDTEWKKMPFERHYPTDKEESIPKPKKFELMKRLAEKLSVDIPFVRIDFYEISGKVYFGEVTFFPGAGLEEFKPFKYDYILGSWLKLHNY